MPPEDSIKSNQSQPVSILDIPGPSGLEAEFIYNFFTPDETVNESGYKGNPNILTLGDGIFTLNESLESDQIMYAIKQEVPRYIKISITSATAMAPVYTINSAAEFNQKMDAMGDAGEIISNNLAALNDDSSLSTASPTNKLKVFLI